MTLPSTINAIIDQSECLYTKPEVENALDNMAEKIHSLLANSNPILLCVLVGGIVPIGNLLPRLSFPLELDYIHASRYLGETQGGKIQWKSELQHDFSERTILIVDDILDRGLTLAALIDYCYQKKAQKIYTAVLVDKIINRQPGGLVKADITGLTVKDRYVFGFGLDYHNYLRNAPGIYGVPKEYE